MAVMKSSDGNDLMLDCRCGCCSGLRFKIDKYSDDGYGLITYTSGNFYTEQDHTVWAVWKKKIRKIWRILRGKDYCYSEVLLSKCEMEEFKEYLLSLE